ncbi:AAA family ATPase [Pyxidicoccus trucidator]|uniref:AAA family ATPase n=1 Tax=Pyxidicoccus trucidator TaxID=2709662 RepID=UPI0013DBD229|nr:AAA family ATPase [Pyxidicoccus trucidator]
MEFTLEVHNFRGLRRVEWTPSGVCAVVGPNGSGKTTLIDVLQLLSDATGYGFTKALEQHGGAYGLRHFEAPSDEPVLFGVRLGTAHWVLQPEVSLGPGGARLPFNEKLLDGNTVVYEQRSETGPMGRHGSHLPDDQLLDYIPALEDSVSSLRISLLIRGYHHHRHYALQALRGEGSRLSGDLTLAKDGRNLFSVLMNWHNRRDQSERWRFVMDHLRACFPEMLADFSFPIAANIVSCEVHTPRGNTLTPGLLPDGFLVTLLHLCAVASSEKHSVVAIDEPENALHPFAIRQLVAAFREWSDKHDVTVLLATHSPVLLDTFKEHPEKVFVMEPGHEVLPVPLDKLKKRSWLAHFSLGDLYERLKYGAPAGVEEE